MGNVKELKPNELRTGNIIDFEDGSTDRVSVNYLLCDEDTWFVNWTLISGNGGFKMGGSLLCDFNPVALTDEILAQCGFIKNKYGRWAKSFVRDGDDESGRIVLFIGNEQGFYYWGVQNLILDTVAVNRIDNLHQLQNLYYALTGEELIFTPQA